MPVPTVATYSAAALVAAQTEFLALLDAGAGAAYVSVRNASGTLLATLPLDDPAGTVNGTTGRLTFSFVAGGDSNADLSGTISYAEFCDSDGNVHLSLPAQSGVVAVSGKIVFNTLTVIAGGPVEMVSATIG